MISGPPSLRRRLLAFLALPMLGLLTFNTILAYYVALDYSNRIHDRNLIDDTHSFAQMLSTMPVTSDLSPQARFLIEYDPDGHRYFNVDSSRMGTLSGNADFSPYAPSQDCTGVHPALYDGNLNGQQVRMATVCTQAMNDPQDQLAVTVAESMADRRQRAREILMIIIPLMTMLALGTAALVWFGVTYGLRILTPLRTRLAQRRGELAPISDADVPEEIQPLISTIDDLFARQAEMITLQNRFIADAAHQLRSPLAGMALHVDQALAHGDPDTVREALQHIRRLNQRTARVSTQLLALSRAQTVPDTVEALDLGELVPQWVGMRVPEAIRDGIDLGYRGSPHPLRVLGNGAMLQEALDNLIDNAPCWRASSPCAAITDCNCACMRCIDLSSCVTSSLPDASMLLSSRPLAMPSASFTAPSSGRVRLRVMAHAASEPSTRLNTPNTIDNVPVQDSVERYSSRLRSVSVS